jgi:predicted transcriptional regulator
MVSSGFFAEPKGLADVQRRLKDKQGREVPVTTLSPVFTRLLREGVLDRSRNSEGTYEYVSTQGS